MIACNNWSVTISQTDIDNAIGNSNIPPFRNGVVYFEYIDCEGNRQTVIYAQAGTYDNSIELPCTVNSFRLFYYANDSINFAINSIFTPLGACSQPVPTLTQTPTSTQTPTITSTPTNTLTSTQTPTNTSTSTQTPTQTPTQTSSSIRIKCGLGWIKISSEYYYTDCCGNFISGVNNTGDILEVTLDYGFAFGGVELLSVTSSVTCVTTTPTPTPTITPTNTVTPTVTPTKTLTPTPTTTPSNTPSNSPVTKLKNDCDVITLFDLGISCNVIQSPTESNPLGGILSVNVTGGTAPYSFFWDGVPGNQTLFGIPAGSYQVVVTDYKWPDGKPNGVSDYTATTICELLGPIPTSTPTMTPTPTQTRPVQCVDLCLIVIGSEGVPNFGPVQFVCDGTQNGRFRWTNGRINIVWNPINSRWEMYVAEDNTTPFGIGGGILASTTFDLIPDSAWTVLGGTDSYSSVTMTRGNCPTVIPLQVSVDPTNSSCQGTTNCNGEILILAENGYPPYSYSINGGITNSSNNTFNNLCPNTYSVVVTDSQNNTQNSSVSIGYDSSPVTYQLSLTNVGVATPIIVSNVSQTITQAMTLVVSPPLPVGVSVTFNLSSTAERTINSPGVADSTVIWSVTKNGQSVSTVISPTTISSQGTRPFCSVNDTQLINTTDYSSSITITNGDVINITSTTIDTITNGQVSSQTNCTTNIKTEIRATILTPTIVGNDCSSVVGSSRQVQTNDFTYVPATITNPCIDCVAQDITIGTQTWSKCNLDITTYRNGDTIPQVTDPTAWVNLTTGAWCYYENVSTNGTTYGKLYNWYAVNDPRGLAPVGYHIPTDTEWTTLTTYLGGESVAGGKIKETGFCHWTSPNTNATNQSSFTALPGGRREEDGIFATKGLISNLWSSSEISTPFSWYRNLNYTTGNIYKNSANKKNGFSVRLIKDPTPPLPEVLEHNAYGSGGNIPLLCSPTWGPFGSLYSYASQGLTPAVGITIYQNIGPNNVLLNPVPSVNTTNCLGWNGGQRYLFTVTGQPGVITTITPCT